LFSVLKKIISYLSDSSDDNASDHRWLNKLKKLEEQINYSFKNKKLLWTALTHDSFIRKSEHENGASSPYERMEFLGDSVLGLIVAEHLFARFPDKDEGDLSKEKSNIVCEKFLALKAMNIHLGEYIKMSEEERRNGGEGRKSIIADTMEALICGIYLDGGIEAARDFVHEFIIKDYEKEMFSVDLTNYKSILQEFTQAKYQCVPKYLLKDETGPDHQKVFMMEVYIMSKKYGEGNGPNKKEAQQKAALYACKRLNIC